MDITIKELKHRLQKEEFIILVDVREPHEHEAFNIGGILMPLGEIPARAEELLPHQNDEIVMYCRSGKRSDTAKHYLTQAGFSNVRNLLGGMLAWQEDDAQSES